MRGKTREANAADRKPSSGWVTFSLYSAGAVVTCMALRAASAVGGAATVALVAGVDTWPSGTG